MSDLISLSTDELNAIEKYLADEVPRAIADRQGLTANLHKWYEAYESVAPEADPDLVWEGASNFFVPITRTRCDRLKIKFFQVLFATSPGAVAKGLNAEAEQWAPKLQAYIDEWARKPANQTAFNELLDLSIRDGTCPLEVNWETRYDTRRVPLMLPDENGQAQVSWHKMDVLEWNSVSIEAQELKDVYLIPSSSRSFKDATYIAKRIWLTLRDVKKYEKKETFYSGVAEMIRSLNTLDTTDNDVTLYGAINPSQSIDDNLNNHEIFEVLGPRPDKSDDDDLYLTYWHKSANKILGMVSYPYFHGKKKYISFYREKRPKRAYGYSLPELLIPVNQEINVIHNQRANIVNLALSPPKLKKKGVLGDEEIVWKPGATIEVEDPASFRIMVEVMGITPAGYQEESELIRHADEIAGTNAMALGQPMSGRRTKAEIQAVGLEGAIGFDMGAKSFMRSMKEFYEMWLELHQQFAPEDGIRFVSTMTGEKEEVYIPKYVFFLPFEIEHQGSYVTWDSSQKRSEKLFLLDLLMRNPLVGGVPGAIPPRMDRIYWLANDLLEEFGVKNIDRIIGKAEEYVQQPQQPGMGGPPGAASAATPNGGGAQGNVLNALLPLLAQAMQGGARTPETGYHASFAGRRQRAA